MRAILVLFLAVGLAGCAPTGSPAPPEMSHGMAVVRVTATYRERILLPPGHVLTVRIEDVSRAHVLAEHRETLDGRAPPYQATLGFPRSKIDPGHTYAAHAEIRDPSGALRFTTDTRHAVLTRGAPAEAGIIMVGVR